MYPPPPGRDFGDDGESVVTAQMPHFYQVLYALLSGSCLAAVALRRSRVLFALMLLTALVVTAILGFVSCSKIFNSMIMKNGEVRGTGEMVEGQGVVFVGAGK